MKFQATIRKQASVNKHISVVSGLNSFQASSAPTLKPPRQEHCFVFQFGKRHYRGVKNIMANPKQ